MKKSIFVFCLIAMIALSATAGFVGAYFGMTHGNQSAAYRSSVLYIAATNQLVEHEAIFTYVAAISEPTTIGLSAIHQSHAPMSIPNLVLAVADTVVEIDTQSVVNSRNRQIVQPGAGSGVIISESGYIVTNNHVIVNSNGTVADSITVRLRNGESHEATVIGRDVETDLAIIKIDAQGLTAAQFGDSSRLYVGVPVVAIGNPLGNLGGTVTEGIISALNRDITVEGETMHVLQTSAAVNQGNSGGGLFNLYGELIGIINAKPIGLGIEGIGFAIPSNVALSISLQLLEYGFVQGRVAFGINLVDINDLITAMLNGVRAMGLYVATNDEASGLAAGDRIVSIAGTNVSNRAQARAVYLNFNVGDTLEVEFVRGNQGYRTQITLQQAVQSS